MERISTSELGEHVGRRVRIAGWLHQRRELSRVTFIVLRDAVGLGQVVFEEPGDAPALPPESVLEVEGEVVAALQAPGGVELHRPDTRVLAVPDGNRPIELQRPQLKEQLPTILDHAPVALRHPRERAKFSIAAASLAGYRHALDGLGFIEIQTPKIVGAATEGGANVFTLDYFGRPAYLAQSPQLYKQVLVGVFERVYETGPAFRAEPHETGRHLAEYVSLDAEAGFIDDHFDVMRFAREAVAGMTEAVRSRCAAAVELLAVDVPDVPSQIPWIDFVDGQRLIEAATGEPAVGEPDLAPAHERRLGTWAREEHGSDFVFVVGYPMEKRPFYTHPNPDRPEFSNSFDLLFRGRELMTGGQRLHRYEDYMAALASGGLPSEPFAAFLEAYRCGMPPHGGWGMGLERWTAGLVGAGNVRATTLFPRDRHRLAP